MRKIYKYLLLVIVGITSIIFILKVAFGISIILDKVNYFLYFLIPIVLIPYTYIGQGYKVKPIIIVKLIIKYSILCVLIRFAFSCDYSKYRFIESPNKMHKIVIKEYNTGFHHLIGHLEIYEVIGGVLKKDTGGRIELNEKYFMLNEDGIQLSPGYENGQIVIEWKDEDMLHIFYAGGTKTTYETDIYETTIRWNN